jgi:hypothetical protein
MVAEAIFDFGTIKTQEMLFLWGVEIPILLKSVVYCQLCSFICHHSFLVIIGGHSFYYGHPSSHCTRGFIAMSNYYTTLEYDGCIVCFVSKICGHANIVFQKL